jgi:hypothetical protein
MSILSTRELWLKAAQWGSYMTAFDPGSVMYSFSETQGFQSREHALAVIDWVETHCLRALARGMADEADTPASYAQDLVDLLDIIDTARAYLGRDLHMSAVRRIGEAQKAY